MEIDQDFFRKRLDELASLFQGVGLEIKSIPYLHQIEGFFLSYESKIFAQNGEQGTGKTWILINELAYLYAIKTVDAALVLAPKGVDQNWQSDELRLHFPDGLPMTCAIWRQNAKARNDLAKLMGRSLQVKLLEDDEEPQKEKPIGLRILLMNYEAITTDKGFDFAERFLMSSNSPMIILDESQKIKNPKGRRAKALNFLKPHSKFRRIATGTPVTNSPFDLFSQYRFLDEKILGSSFMAFKTEYAEILKSGGFYQSMFKKQVDKLVKLGIDPELAKLRAKHRMPQLVAKDDDGRPIYKNLDRLREIIAPHCYRVLKKDCLDLPEKIYKKIYFDLTEEQQKIYDRAKGELRLKLDEETFQILTALTAIQKLSQISSGFFIETVDHVHHRIEGDNPKKEVLKDLIEDLDGKTIIWATFKAELADIKEACSGISHVEYHGGISDEDRKIAIERFQRGDAQVFIGNPKSGGVGITLNAASSMIYYSNNFSLEIRQQSEDRGHRIGLKNDLVIYDLVAKDTIEERIIDVLQSKSDMASVINGDFLR